MFNKNKKNSIKDKRTYANVPNDLKRKAKENFSSDLKTFLLKKLKKNDGEAAIINDKKEVNEIISEENAAIINISTSGKSKI